MTVTAAVPPSHLKASFKCPLCGVYAAQTWYDVLGIQKEINFQHRFGNIEVARCSHCDGASVWENKKMILPRIVSAPPPNEDLDAATQLLYAEAANIQADSARGAAALLRLCLQMICKQLGEESGNLNHDIGSLVSRGLSEEIQQALDVVRVIGNNAVHPGQIDVSDNDETVSALFTLINLIAEKMITIPKMVSQLHNQLPPSIREAIAKRDQNAPKAALPPPRNS